MMKAMMKQVKLGMALVAVMFALAAQAETYYLRHLDNYQADPGSTSSMTALGSCAGWADSPDATSASVKKMEAGNTLFLARSDVVPEKHRQHL